MKVVGIIVEYNPIHNGHLYHIEQARKLSKCDCLVAVMSGNFVQRGEPSSIDKFTKAEIALNHGIDLVVELPTVYATQSADLFAYGAVSILKQLNVSEIYFGAENANIKKFNSIVEKLDDEQVNIVIKQELEKGNSYPRSLAIALDDHEFLTPNNTLGIQYINAIKKLKADIKAVPIKRINANYHDTETNDSNIASATAIRNLINTQQDITNYVPTELNNLNTIKTWNDFFPLLNYKLKTMNVEDLGNIHQVDEGLNHKLFMLAKENLSYEMLLNDLISKRYTKSRINRILLNVLLNITKDEIKEINLLSEAKYVRILGMNDNGKKLLSLVNKDEVNIITSLVDHKYPMMDIELRASNIYYNDSESFKREYKKPIIKG